MTVKNRIAITETAVDKLIDGQYCGYDIHWVCNSITWLYKYKHIDTKKKDELVDKVMLYFDIDKVRSDSVV